MYCNKCGSQNPDNAQSCSACGALLQISNTGQTYSNTSYNSTNNTQYPGTPNNGTVQNNLVFAILATVFCCLPLGIVAIMTSMKVDERLRMGDYNGAVDAANKTKTYCLIALALGVIVYAIYFFAVVLASM